MAIEYSFKNNLKAELYEAMTAAQTTIKLKQLVESDDAAVRLAAWPLLDSTSATHPYSFHLTLEDKETGDCEIILCTDVQTNTADYIEFVCTRAVDGTTAATHALDATIVENREIASFINHLSHIYWMIASDDWFNTLVSIATNQTITGNKTFSGTTSFTGTSLFNGTTSFTGTATTVTPASSSNDTTIPTTSWVTDKVLANTATRNVGELVYSLIPLVDASLHLLNGALLYDNGVYAAFVDYMKDLYDSGDHTNLFVTESQWQQSVSTYGVCGKFVWDSITGTLRLPKVTGLVEGTIVESAIGDLVEAGLPNIEGSLSMSYNVFQSPTGAFNSSPANTATSGASGSLSISGVRPATFSASDSNSIYGNSTTVQPQSIRGFIYMVVANFTKTEIAADIDEIAADLQLKADVSDVNDLAVVVAGKTDGKVTLLGSRTTNGDWTLTNLVIGKPLIITASYTSSYQGVRFRATAGTLDGVGSGGTYGFYMGYSNFISSDCGIFIPTATSVTINISEIGSTVTVRAYQ